jgi:hypothetical protein
MRKSRSVRASGVPTPSAGIRIVRGMNSDNRVLDERRQAKEFAGLPQPGSIPPDTRVDGAAPGSGNDVRLAGFDRVVGVDRFKRVRFRSKLARALELGL